MRLYQVIKPSVFKGKTKASLLSAIQTSFGGLRFTVSNRGNCYAKFDQIRTRSDDLVVGINFEKRRRKTKLTSVPKKFGDPGFIQFGKKNFRREIVRESHWMAWVYIIPQGFVVDQGSRTFTVQLKKAA